MLMEHPRIPQKQYVSRPAFVPAHENVVNVRAVLHNYPSGLGITTFGGGGGVPQRTAAATCQSSNQLPRHPS